MPVNPEPDYYEIIGVESSATQEEIDKAFRKARRDNHPDKAGASAWAFRLVETAYDTLKDPDSRAAYDESLRTGSGTSTPPPQTQTQTQPPPNSTNTGASSSNPNQGAQGPQANYQPPTNVSQSDSVAQTQDTPTSYVVQPVNYESTQTKLENFTFSPPSNLYKTHILGSLGLSLLGVAGMFLSWFTDLYKPVLLVIALLFTLAAVGIAMKKGEVPRGGVISVVLLVLGWVITGFPLFKLPNPMQEPIYLFSDAIFMLGGILAVLFVPRYLKIKAMNKRVPVKLLKDHRVYGSASHDNPNVAAVLRNVSDTLIPITYIKDGSFVLHVDDIKLDDRAFPGQMVVIRGNKIIVVSVLAGLPGKYGVSTDGNIVRIVNGNLTHIENDNPKVLEGCAVMKKALPEIETKSLVVLISLAPGQVESYHAEGTSVVSLQEALATLVQDFEEPVTHVRRDAINLLVPSLSNRN